MLVRCNPLLRMAMSAVLFLMVVIAVSEPVRAQSAGDVFTVERVPVDVTATNAALARDQGIAQAQRDAFTTLFDRLTLDEDGVQPPPLGNAEIERLVESFEVVSERTSPVRYVAEISVRFRPAGIRALMLSSGIRYAEVRSKPVLVLPIDMTGADPVLWQRETAWRTAWEAFEAPPGLLPILVPYGELQDVTDIGVAEALVGDETALRRIADRYGAGAVAVARVGLDGELDIPGTQPDPFAPADPTSFLASPGTESMVPAEPVVEEAPVGEPMPEIQRPRGLMVVTTIHRFRGEPDHLVIELPPSDALPAAEPLPGMEQPPADPAPSIFAEVPQGTPTPEDAAAPQSDGLPPGVAELMPLAVQRTATAMEQGWIRANLLETGQESVVAVRVPLAGLEEWMETRNRLGQVATVTRTRLIELSRNAAEVELFYLGDSERLRTALAQRDLILDRPVTPLPGQMRPAGGMETEGWTLQWRGAAGFRPASPAYVPDPGSVSLPGPQPGTP